MKKFNAGEWGADFWQIPIKFFFMIFFSADTPMMHLVLQQDPKIENIGLISKGELLLAVSKLSPWCFIGIGRILSPEGYLQSLLKSENINRHTEGINDVP